MSFLAGLFGPRFSILAVASATLIAVAVGALTGRYIWPLAPEYSFTVEGIGRAVDGDDILLTQTTTGAQAKIRLSGIDAPEKRQKCWKEDGSEYPCGGIAHARLASMIDGQKVTCDIVGLAAHDRPIGECRVGLLDINTAMVRQGQARAYRKYSCKYAEQEAIAKVERVGIWQGEHTAPWCWLPRSKNCEEADPCPALSSKVTSAR